MGRQLSAPPHPLNRAVGNWNLGAQIRVEAEIVIAQSVADGIFRREDEELIIGHLQPELLGDVLVVGRRLVASTAGAVEASSGVDARGGDVAVVLARKRVACSACGRRGPGGSERGEEERRDDVDGLHCR